MRNIFWLLLIIASLGERAIAEAEQATRYRIGWISAAGDGDNTGIDAFRVGMRDLGYIEGRNLVIDARFAEGSSDHLERLAVELVKSKPQVIVTQAGQAIFAVRRAGAGRPPEAGSGAARVSRNGSSTSSR